MKNPRGFKKRYFSLAAILAFSATTTLANETKSFVDKQESTVAQEEYSESEELTPPSEELDVVVISKKIKVKEVDAPFASEIYTKKQIEKSHSKDIYEFLNTQTSVTTVSNNGNNFTQKIDLRGYGIGDGYQNVVVSVNGKRLNNIDMVPQLLSSIPIDSVEKIEIIKGSGSVEYGDGANAGVINIVTKGYEGASFKTYFGDNGLLYGSVGLGIKRDKFSISGYINDYRHDGYKEIGTDGTKDESSSQNKGVNLTFTPIDKLTFNLSKAYSKMNINYANALTLQEYNQNPKTIPQPSWGVPYLEQFFSSDVWDYGFNYKATDKVLFDFQIRDEKKVSDFITYNSKNNYRYKSYDAKIDYSEENIKTVIGLQKFDGERRSSTNTTTKDNLGYFVKLNYDFLNSKLSFGARGENIKYTYNKSAVNLNDKKFLRAYDLGYNYKLDKISSIFINFNQSFQSPDIDRFFNAFTDTFNGFIKPMKVKTVNLGYNKIGYPNKLKVSAFYSDIEDEIYYNASTWTNTNLDKTRKYGFELYDKYNILYNLYTTLNYSYVDTKIIKDSVNPSIVGNEIPGVSKHNVKLGVGYNPTHRINLLLTHTYKSKAYAMSDFDHSFGKMEAYNSTDFSATYKYKKYKFFAKINNLFDKSNALFADDGTNLGVYPVNYERNFIVGMSAKF
ncbi:TonB-dependent receptor plug domain-containing protein [Sulfurospirillum sp. 1307]